MSRQTFHDSRYTPAAQAALDRFHPDMLREVELAVAREAVVVVGMAQNPHVKRARKALEAAGVAFHYLEYGSYLSKWKERLAIKMWSGWPTFPQVYAHGMLVGGADDVQAAIADGSLKALLEGGRDQPESEPAS